MGRRVTVSHNYRYVPTACKFLDGSQIHYGHYEPTDESMSEIVPGEITEAIVR
jgi:hypothetical protein